MISQELNKLNEEIKVCVRCKTVRLALQPIHGEGCVPAKVMFVGRCPGKTEDLGNRPFIGQSGEKVLNPAIVWLGLKRETCYITNLCKCYPYNDRLNTDEEMDNCIHYLWQEILSVKPKVVILMGRQPCDKLLGISNLRRRVGQSTARSASGVIYIPMVHPSATLKDKSGKMKVLWEKGLVLIKKVLKQENIV